MKYLSTRGDPQPRAFSDILARAKKAGVLDAMDGVLIHQILGKLKEGDIPADVRADAINSLTLRLAENLTVRSIYSSELGRLLSLRVRGQNNIIVNLSGYATRGTEITLDVAYSGRLEPAEPDREALAPQFPQDRPEVTEGLSFPSETSLL